MSIIIGIDLGSTAIKVVFVKDKEIVFKEKKPTVPGQEMLAEAIIQTGLQTLGINREKIQKIGVTGYGKKLYKAATDAIDEISANAAGAFQLSSRKVRTIVNIGGQDVKVIRLSEDGKVNDFRMNDKCAAGTGRFFEMVARILDTPIFNFDELSQQATDIIDINSTCAVFAESEIISLLARGVSRENIVAGFQMSVARRVAKLIRYQTIEEDVYMDGGPARSEGLARALEEELLRPIYVLPEPQFTVAYGAALLIQNR